MFNYEKSTSERPESVKLTGRPERDTVISSDDITNLKIALNTASDLNEFLGRC